MAEQTAQRIWRILFHTGLLVILLHLLSSIVERLHDDADMDQICLARGLRVNIPTTLKHQFQL